jgi:hypothetical protein
MPARRVAAAILIVMLWGARLAAQTSPPASESGAPVSTPDLPQQDESSSDSLFASGSEPKFAAAADPAPFTVPVPVPNNGGGVQTKRIAGFVPNFQAVSADTVVQPLSFKQKFMLASHSTFDYSSFAFVGLQAGIEEATNTYPEFHKGEAGFARYYWHTFADQAVGNYVTGAILPSLTHEDPRYYTHYHGSFLHRTAYAFSRLWITRNDAGKETFNISEIVGVGVSTGVSGFYYPTQERVGVGENCVKWASQLLNDGIGNVFEEFWPDINRKFLHER